MAAVAHRQEIAAPPATVWELISAPGYLEGCHPFCADNPVERWPGIGARDRVEYYSGRSITRDFTSWQDGAGYDLEATDADGPVAQVSWRLVSNGAGSALTIAITPRMLGRVPAALRWAPERLLVRPMLRRYLRAVLSGIEWRVATGRPAARNQFGSHRWFSP